MPANVVSVAGVDFQTILVTFDAPVDGTLLDADWWHDTDDDVFTLAFTGQVDPVSCTFQVPPFSVSGGAAWEITRPQAPLVFPQSGNVS